MMNMRPSQAPVGPGPVEAMSAEGIVPENAPSIVPANDAGDWPDLPEFLRCKQELSAALIKQQPWLKNSPEKLEALVLARIR
jgi:hypothetical protein